MNWTNFVEKAGPVVAVAMFAIWAIYKLAVQEMKELTHSIRENTEAIREALRRLERR